MKSAYIANEQRKAREGWLGSMASKRHLRAYYQKEKDMEAKLLEEFTSGPSREPQAFQANNI